jgi:hypothetical protein
LKLDQLAVLDALVLLLIELLSLTLQLQFQAAGDVPIQLQGDRHATQLQRFRLISIQQ